MDEYEATFEVDSKSDAYAVERLMRSSKQSAMLHGNRGRAV